MWAGWTPPRVPRPREVRGVQVLARPDLPGPSLPMPDFSGPPDRAGPPALAQEVGGARQEQRV